MKPIPLSDVTAAAAALKARRAEDPPSGTVSAARAIALLRREIRALQAKGYPQAEILTVLHQHHIEITAHTLRTYLSRAAESPGPPRPRPGRPGTTRPAVPAAEATDSSDITFDIPGGSL
ncbi:MAG: hypothetical protein ACYCVY_02040 [Acidiferrobacteraceae bacterium]